MHVLAIGRGTFKKDVGVGHELATNQIFTSTMEMNDQ